MNKQFDDTYKLSPRFSENPENLKKQRFIEETQVRIQSELPIRPANISYFETLMYKPDQSKKSKPRVGYFCNMVPGEIIRALGAEPVRLDCGNNAASQVGEEVLSGEICPLTRASFGSFLNSNSLANTCDFLVLPAACDAKRKMGEILNDFKPTFMYNLPPEQNHRTYSDFSFRETLRLVTFLETHLAAKLSRKILYREIQRSQKRSLLVRTLQEERIEKPTALSMTDFFLIIQSYLFRPVQPDEWLLETEKVIKEIRSFQPERTSLRPRLILTGAPIVWPNFKLLNLIEESGADIAADTLCTGGQSCFDPVVTDELGKKALLHALTNRYVFASICPCFISQTTRLNRIIDLFKTAGAEGVINYSLRLCQLFDMENFRLVSTLKNLKIPYLNTRSDYSLEDTEQLRVRIEAFLETL
jgi:benzoyl-CoA reductase/2-hydroxyglutaryl-CoA dehydratase subunit BcrC/BadD/HgdB